MTHKIWRDFIVLDKDSYETDTLQLLWLSVHPSGAVKLTVNDENGLLSDYQGMSFENAMRFTKMALSKTIANINHNSADSKVNMHEILKIINLIEEHGNIFLSTESPDEFYIYKN